MAVLMQRTIKQKVSAVGVGVHTGKKIKLEIKPAAEDHGIVFYRKDLPGVKYRAISDNVGDTRLSTSLGIGEKQISTVEHITSALAGLGVDNAEIWVNDSEVPVMDGSASPFVFLIQTAGIKEQKKPKKFLKIKKRIKVEKGDMWAMVEPHHGFKISLELSFDHPLIKKSNQKAVFDFSSISYVKEVSRARTFGFMKDYEDLRANDLALGSSLDNTVALDDYRVINEDGLRYQDEFVRHKILDAVGDLYLLGMGMIGSFSGFKSGHTLNNMLVKALLADKTAYDIINVEETESPINFVNVASAAY